MSHHQRRLVLWVLLAATLASLLLALPSDAGGGALLGTDLRVKQYGTCVPEWGESCDPIRDVVAPPVDCDGGLAPGILAISVRARTQGSIELAQNTFSLWKPGERDPRSLWTVRDQVHIEDGDEAAYQRERIPKGSGSWEIYATLTDGAGNKHQAECEFWR